MYAGRAHLSDMRTMESPSDRKASTTILLALVVIAWFCVIVAFAHFTGLSNPPR